MGTSLARRRILQAVLRPTIALVAVVASGSFGGCHSDSPCPKPGTPCTQCDDVCVYQPVPRTFTRCGCGCPQPWSCTTTSCPDTKPVSDTFCKGALYDQTCDYPDDACRCMYPTGKWQCAKDVDAATDGESGASD